MGEVLIFKGGANHGNYSTLAEFAFTLLFAKFFSFQAHVSRLASQVPIIKSQFALGIGTYTRQLIAQPLTFQEQAQVQP